MLLTVAHYRQDVAQRPPLRESKPKHSQPQKWNEVRNQVLPHSFHSHLMFSLSSFTFKFLMKSLKYYFSNHKTMHSLTYTETYSYLFHRRTHRLQREDILFYCQRHNPNSYCVTAFPTAIAGYLLTAQGMSTNEKQILKTKRQTTSNKV